MSFLDVRTVVFGQLVTNAICAAVLFALWGSSKKRFRGAGAWALDLVLQTLAVVLLILRGKIPDLASMVGSNACVIGGAMLGYAGLLQFAGLKTPGARYHLLLAPYAAVQTYFVAAQPSLEARNVNVSLWLLLVCFQCVWLIWRRVEGALQRHMRPVGVVFGAFCLVTVVRMALIVARPSPSNDFFQSGAYDALVLMAYQALLILLTFGLVMMVTRRLHSDVQREEEKYNNLFHSSPYGIVLTRMSDGLVLDTNDGFGAMSGYGRDETVGRTTHDLGVWAHEEDRADVVAALASGNRVQARECLFRKKGGETLTGLFSADMVVVDRERCVLSSISDITERKAAEDARRQSEERYRSLFDTMLEGFCIIEVLLDADERPIDYTFVETNPAFEAQTGLHNANGKRIREIAPDNEPHWFEIYGRVALTGEPARFENEARALGRWFEVFAYRVGAPEDRHVAILFNDITVRRRAETALRASETRFRTAVEEAPFPILIHAEDGEVLAVSRAWTEISGYTAADIPTIAEWTVKAYGARKELVRADIDALYGLERRKTEGEYVIMCQDGTQRIWDFSSVGLGALPDGRRTAISMAADVTERKRAEDALRASSAYLDNLVNYANAPIIVWDPGLRVTRFNHAFEALTGRLAAEVVGQPIEVLFPKETVESSLALIARASAGERWQTVEIGIQHVSGPVRTVVWNSATIYSDDGVTPIATIAQGADVTERNRAEEALRTSEARFRTAVEEAPFPIMIHAEDGEVLAVSRAWTEISGYTRADIPTIAEWTAKAYGVSRGARMADIATLYGLVERREEGEHTFTCRDGSERVWDFSSVALGPLSDGRRTVISIAADVTDRRIREKELAERNAELHRIMYTISHDLKSPVVTVKSFLGFLEEDAAKGDTVRVSADAAFIHAAVDKMGRLLDELLEISRVGRVGGPLVTVAVDDVVKEALASVAGRVADGRVDIRTAPMNVTLHGDRHRLVEIWENLIDNAAKYMGGQAAPWIEIGAEGMGRDALFYVRDNGLGIEPRYHAKVFDLFEQLDPTCEGTGVGLALVKRIVEVYGGTIRVESEGLGNGACFRFTLPEAVVRDQEGDVQ